MPVTRSRTMPESAAQAALESLESWWSPALASLYPMALDKAHPWSRMAEQAQGAAEAAAGHWRALAEVQMSAAGQAFSASLNLATAQAEHRREALTHVMRLLWPTPAQPFVQEETLRA